MKLLIDTEWAVFISDLPTDKQLELFWAIFDYGNHECSLKCWKKIQPILEKGKIGYYNKLKKLKQYSDTDADTDTDTVTDTDTDTNPTRLPCGGERVLDKKYIVEHSSSLRNTRASKFIPPTLQEVIDYAAEQTQFRGVGGFLCPRSIAEEFWAHYDSQGWKKSNDSQTPVTNWQSALRLWAKKQSQFDKPQPDLPV